MIAQRETPKTPTRPGRNQTGFSPIHIRTFQECPEKYYWRYVRRTKTPKTFSRNLEIGRVTHNVLAFVWNQRRSGFEDPDDLRGLVNRYLKESAYPEEDVDHFPEDRETIIEHVERALAGLESRASVYGVEQVFAHTLDSKSSPSVEVRSKIDLVLEHADGGFEHVDYKTGRPERDLDQEVMSRVALRSNLIQTGHGDRPVLTTTIFSSNGSAVREELGRAESAERWREIVGTIELIRASEIWRPNPGGQCKWCEYCDYTCSARGISS